MSTTLEPVAAPRRTPAERSGAWYHNRIETAAYYLAEKRGFQPGFEAADWYLAEAEADALDASGD
jgi:hypothetical protein